MCGPCAMSKMTDMHSQFFCPECQQPTYPMPQFGTMCEHLSLTYFQNPLTLCTEVSLARTLALQEIEKAWQVSEADFSLKSSDWCVSYDQDSFSWRTSQLSLFGGLIEFSWSSLRSGMILGGQLFQPQKLVPRIFENDGFYLPTPTASDYGKNQGRKQDNTPSGRSRYSLTYRARRGEVPNHPKGKLNPEWVEQAMGYNSQWTEIEPWAIAWFRPKREKLLKG